MRYENQDVRVAIILDLSMGLKAKGSWCGETHIQKTAYVLKSLGIDQLDYDFILYKHGPYSFDLHGELGTIRSANLMSLLVLQERYGPSFEVTQLEGRRFLEKHKKVLSSIKKKIDFVLNWVGDKDVKALEKIATALMIKNEHPSLGHEHRARILTNVKPHISLTEAENATRQVDIRIEEAVKSGVIKQSELSLR